MSTEMIILIVGALFILIALVDIGLFNTKLRIPMGIIGILLLIYGGYTSEPANMPSPLERVEKGNVKEVKLPVDKVQIISPLEADAVKCRILSMGVYPASHTKDIWILLKPTDNRYYPQSDHTNTSYKRNGEWQVITRFGGDKDEKYEIIVYETDSAASEFFSSTIATWNEAKSFPGLEKVEIPSGANEVDRIVVSLEDNCRGVF